MEGINDTVYADFIFTEQKVKKYISMLKSGCAAGIDGIVSEHLKYESNSKIVLHLCRLLSVCFQFGVIPSSAMKGILVPLIKKPSLNPSDPKNYRPVILSNILSKNIEMYILQECSNFQFNDMQFGFVRGRGTGTAISLANDVCSYFVNNGSQVYMCGLDAEGAFDTLPHPVIFSKATDVIPDICWRLLFYWYVNMSVQIRWGPSLSDKIHVQKGTRHGLTSTFLFHLFYKDLVDTLNEESGGLTIGYNKFNVFCYADDLLIASATVPGLQNLIDKANAYVMKHGLRFNPLKTNCVIAGKMPFLETPNWHIGDTTLNIESNLSYLGSYLGNNCGSVHVASRISACRKSFFSLQGAGLCKIGLNIDTATHVWSAACSKTLLYGCEAIYINETDKCQLDKLQAKLVKCSVGIGPKYHTTALLDALCINKISLQIDINSMFLLRNIIHNHTGASKFYLSMLRINNKYANNVKSNTNLCERVKNLCDIYNVDLWKFLLDEQYSNQCKSKIKNVAVSNNDGLIDSIRFLLRNRSSSNIHLLKLF